MPQSVEIARNGSPVDLLRDEAALPDGCNSPRTKIARKLGAMDLENSFSDTHRDWTHSPRKRTRLSSEELPVSSDDDSVNSDLSIASTEVHMSTESSTNDVTTASPRQQSRLTHFLKSTKPTKRLRSPPLPKSIGEDEHGQLESGHAIPSTMTWQDSEITGMAVDFAAGDDGEGINGIAFRPTAQLAYERRQRRKQQVNAWKVREAREARARRLERRNGCKVENLSERARDKHRTVRFVDPGS